MGRQRFDARKLEVSDELYERLMVAAGGSHVAARAMFERLCEKAMRVELQAIQAEHRRQDAKNRANISRQRQKFGWSWRSR